MSSKPQSRVEIVMGVSMIACVVFGVIGLFSSDGGGDAVIPFAVAVIILINLSWMRSEAAKRGRER